MRTRHQKPRVGIVGAGFAGLRCAEVLLRNGIEVVILESKGRVGGRVCQSIVDGHAIDLGPNWIHGTEQNPIYEIAKKTDTVYHSWDHGRTRVIDKNDVEMDHHRAEELSTAMWDVVAKAYEFSGKHGSDIPASRGLVDFLKCEGREHLREHFQKIRDKDRSSEFPKDTIEADVNDTVRLADMWGGFVGTEYERQSLRFFWLEEMLDGENPFVASTYKNILAHVAAYALSKQVVRLEEPVTSIISVPDQDKYSAVEVRTTKGSYSFDEVIVTTPLGWLKSNPRAFDPPLTSRVSQAIEHVSYGNLEKIYVTFPSAWWEQPVAYTNGIIVNGAATHRSPVNHSASFTHWVSPRHPGLGNAQAVSLASLPPSVAHPTLLFYTYGATSKHNVLELSKLPTIEAQHAYLDAFLRPYYTTLPHFAPTDPACVPTAFHATTWSADPYAGYGSYSNFQVDATDVDRDIEAMRDGMPERRVWFAGEHTAPFVATGTTTGAYWAGEEVARRVLEAYGRERTDASTLPERPGEKKKVAKRSSEKWGQANGWAE